MKAAVGILSLVATKAAASATKNEQGAAVSSESKRASKGRSSPRRGLRNAEVSSAAFEEAERVKAETLDTGVLDVGTAASCPAELRVCFDETATVGENVNCVGLIYGQCYPESLPDDAESNAEALVPCFGEGATIEDAEDECYVSYCIYGCDPESNEEEYNKCLDVCYYGEDEDSTETGSTTVPSVLSEKK